MHLETDRKSWSVVGVTGGPIEQGHYAENVNCTNATPVTKEGERHRYASDRRT